MTLHYPHVTDLPGYADERGILLPIWNCSRNTELENSMKAGADLWGVSRTYLIHNSQKGVVRGFHYHQHEIKHFFIVRGMAKFVAVKVPFFHFDARSLSEMKPYDFDVKEGMHTWQGDLHLLHKEYNDNGYSFVLTDKRPQMVTIPTGYANGWMSLTDDTILLALSTSNFEESKVDDTRINPYLWGNVWKVEAR